jgi:hypothetical protein
VRYGLTRCFGVCGPLGGSLGLFEGLCVDYAALKVRNFASKALFFVLKLVTVVFF